MQDIPQQGATPRPDPNDQRQMQAETGRPAPAADAEAPEGLTTALLIDGNGNDRIFDLLANAADLAVVLDELAVMCLPGAASRRPAFSRVCTMFSPRGIFPGSWFDMRQTGA